MIHEDLLEEIVFELTTAHEESLKDEEKALATMLPMQVGFKCPEKGVANYSRIFQSLFKQELSQRRMME